MRAHVQVQADTDGRHMTAEFAKQRSSVGFRIVHKGRGQDVGTHPHRFWGKSKDTNVPLRGTPGVAAPTHTANAVAFGEAPQRGGCFSRISKPGPERGHAF